MRPDPLPDSASHSRRMVVRAAALSATAIAAGLAWGRSAAGAAVHLPTASSRLALATTSGCATLTEELTQGPFWVDERLERSDVRADSETGAVQAGVPLRLTINLQDAGASCSPQAGAFVDIWHANAQGTYSDVSGAGNPDNVGLDWLRGYQISDDNGSVTFTTIMPGYYTSRTIHIHFRVRVALESTSTINFTSQLFFEESVNNAFLATTSYQQSRARDTSNSADGLYDAALVVPITGTTSTGYSGTFTVNVDFADGTGTPSTGSDELVEARVPSVSVITRRGRRTISVALVAGEKVTVKLRLVRGDDVLAVRTYGWLRRGRRHLRLEVPNGTGPGAARIQLNLADAAGNHRVIRRRIVLPRR